MHNKTIFYNFLLFQVGWFLCVKYHNTFSGFIALSLFLINTYYFSWKHNYLLLLNIIIATLGFCNDLIIIKLNIIDVNNNIFWLYGLWLLFVSIFQGCLSWLSNTNLLVKVILGALGGAFSYLAGFKLGAFQYARFTPDIAFFIHLLNWAILFPILYNTHRYLFLKIGKE